MFDYQTLEKKTLLLFVWILFLNVFFKQALGIAAFSLLVFGLILLLSRLFAKGFKEQITSAASLIAGIGILQIGLLFRSTDFVVDILVFSTLLIGVIYFFVVAHSVSLAELANKLFYVPFTVLREYVYSVIMIFGMATSKEVREKTLSHKSSDKKIFSVPLLLGFCVGLPVVLILVSLLTKADPIFSYYLQNFKEIIDVARIPFSIFFFLLFVPLIIWKKSELVSLGNKIPRNFFIKEYSVVMTLVMLVLGLFLVIQAPYIFVNVSSEVELSKFGVATYSEYVQKGFVELLKVTFFVYLLLWAGIKLIRKSDDSRFLFIIQNLVLVELFIFVASVFRRVYLYQAYHGLTLIRAYGSIFLIWLVVMIVGLWMRHFRKNAALFEISLSMLLLLVVLVSNVENVIATRYPPTVNHRVDTLYLSRMSEDGYEGWKTAYEHSKKTLNNPAYFSDAIIMKNDRREIAYAGMALKNIMESYHNMTVRYASDEELRAYYAYILENELAQYERTIARFKQEKNLVGISKMDINLRNDWISQLNEQYSRLKGAYNQLSADKLKEENQRYLGLNVFDENVFNFNATWENGSSMYESFFEGQYARYIAEVSDVQMKRYDKKSNRYLWHPGKMKVYEKMKTEISLEELLQLERKYFELRQKIVIQPSNEREYENDISSKSYLLD